MYELSKAASEKCATDCREFIAGNLQEWQEYLVCDGTAWSQAGQDFWLTRNGHGVGFWDRGLNDLGERLSKAAKVYGPCDPYLNSETNEVEI